MMKSLIRRLIEQGHGWQCTSCDNYFVEYDRICPCCKDEKQFQYRDGNSIIVDLKDDLLEALKAYDELDI